MAESTERIYIPECWYGSLRIDMAYGPFDIIGLAKFIEEKMEKGARGYREDVEIRIRVRK